MVVFRRSLFCVLRFLRCCGGDQLTPFSWKQGKNIREIGTAALWWYSTRNVFCLHTRDRISLIHHYSTTAHCLQQIAILLLLLMMKEGHFQGFQGQVVDDALDKAVVEGLQPNCINMICQLMQKTDMLFPNTFCKWGQSIPVAKWKPSNNKKKDVCSFGYSRFFGKKDEDVL